MTGFMSLQALIFDLDGTIADTEEHHRLAFNTAFAQLGLDWHWSPSTYADLLQVSGGPERIGAYVKTLDLPPTEAMRLIGQTALVHRCKSAAYADAIAAGGVRARPGVARLVGEARAAGLRIGVVATSTWFNVEPVLSAALGPALRAAIGPIVHAHHVSRRKPSPDLYERMLAELGQPAAACAAFEDSANGVAAARSAGLFTVATPTRWTMAQDFASADLLMTSLGDPGAPVERARPPIKGDWLDLTRLAALHDALRRAA